MAERAGARCRLRCTGASVVTALCLAACAGSAQPVFEREAFGSTGTYSHAYPGAPAHTCEAARRALLSQGYAIESAAADAVRGHKNFQPEPETHIQIAFSVVCAMDGGAGGAKPARTLAFVNAVQDRYALKKSNNSASVGLSVLGSVSLPFSSSDDSLVKVASETIGAPDFYGRFFGLVARYLAPDADDLPPPAGTPADLPTPASASPPAAGGSAAVP